LSACPRRTGSMLVDEKTIKDFKKGNAAAFDGIYLAYSGSLYHFTLGLVKNAEIAQDLVQEIFVCLWEKRDKVNPDLNFDNYIFTIASNAIRKHFRKKAVELKAIDHLIKTAPEISESSEKTAIYKELLEMANQSIDKLPPRRKTVYKLSRQEGMKIKEIACKLDISPRTAANQLAKALDFLKKELSNI